MSLTKRLQSVDGSAPSIQGAAGELMRHYDTNTDGAVLDWRNALFNARKEQILPLLYVANEVLQNSKRNRGNKYLEAFSKILPQSLEYMVEHLPKDVERIRRVVKIWGDRHVFSIRFINDVLFRLEPYRDKRSEMIHDIVRSEAQLSPIQSGKPKETTPSPAKKAAVVKESKSDDDDDDDIMQILDGGNEDQNDDDDGDDDLFGSSSQPKLEIDVNIGAMPIQDSEKSASKSSGRTKRRRSSGGGSTRRSSALSSTNMVDLWTQLLANKQDVDFIVKSLKDLRAKVEKRAEGRSNLFGDELLQAVKMNHRDKMTAVKYRQKLFHLTKERREIEQQALRYYHWIAQSMRSDVSEMELSDTVEAKLIMWAPWAERLVAVRNTRREQEAAIVRAQEEQKRREREAAEAAAFRATALAKETEAKPGMVWNPTTREYQALNTDESWRD